MNTLTMVILQSTRMPHEENFLIYKLLPLNRNDEFTYSTEVEAFYVQKFINLKNTRRRH